MPPRLGRRRRVPVPRLRVDDGIVHPVPLTVQDVVADLHVLEDLRQTEHGGSCNPRALEARRDQQRTPDQSHPPLQPDDAADVVGVALAEVVLDLLVQLVEELPELFDLLVRELVEGVLLGGRIRRRMRCNWGGHRLISTAPSGALMQVRICSPGLPETLPLRRSRTWPDTSSPTQVWQMPSRHP